jgi:hypothetical protein
MLCRLVYYSENRLDAACGSVLHALRNILSASRRNNARRGLTGALAFDDLWFYQVLEGERDVVWSAFKTIMRDERHGDVTLVECLSVEDRMFGDWTMRLAQRSHQSDHMMSLFTIDGIVRPHLMNGRDIVAIITAMLRPSHALAGAA